MRRLLLVLLSATVVSAAGCSGASPVAPSPVASGSLDAKADKPATVNGVLEAFDGMPDAFQFVVDTIPVRGDADTEFFGESLFSHLSDGVRVEVKGSWGDGFVYAKRIHVNSRLINEPVDDGTDDTPPPPPPPACSWPSASEEPGAFPMAPRFGEIFLTSLSGTEPDLVLGGAGRPVYTSSTTIVRRNNDLLPFWILRPGIVVEIFGTWDSTRIDAAEVNLSRNTLDVNAEGEATLVAGDYPEVRFVVGTSQFLANEWTRFSGSPCDLLVEGAVLRVRGVRMADGVTVLATFVEPVVP